MKNNKMTAEEHDANKLGKRYSERFMEEMVGNIMYIIIRQTQKCVIPEKFLTGREWGSKK